MKQATKEKIWFIFCFIFIVANMKIKYANYIKYANLLLMQFFCIIDMIPNFDKYRKFNRGLFINYLTIIFSMFLSTILSPMHSISFTKVLGVIDFVIFSSLLLPIFLRDVPARKIFLYPLIAFSIVIFFAMIVFRNDNKLSLNSARIGSVSRLYAGFSHPNILGFFTFINCIFFVIIITQFKNENSNLIKKILWICFFGSLYTLIKTDCRTALYAFVIFSIIYYFEMLNKNNMKYVKIIEFLMGIFLMFLILLNVNDIKYLDRLSSYRISSSMEAIDELIKDNELLFGKGGFKYSSISSDEDFTYIDMSYISIIYQFGLITFIFTILMFFNLYRIILRINARDQKIIFCIFFIFVIYNLMENLIFNASNFISIFMYMIIFYYFNKTKNDAEKMNGKDINNITSV